MRLTLRTMLAYLDNILEPQDAEALGAKIGESEFARDLVYRTLNSTGKANLAAPPLSGRGMGADPNSVAEYLDNTLDESKIPGFEKACLESDMYLSEVACCHSILSICIDQPVTIENEMRERVLGLTEASLTPGGDVAPAGQAGQTRPTLKQLTQPKPAGTPEYIRKKVHPLWRATVVMTFLGLIFIIGLRAVGPLDASHPWIGALLSEAQSEQGLTPSGGGEEDATGRSQADSADQSLDVSPRTTVQPVGVPEDLNIAQRTGDFTGTVTDSGNAMVFSAGDYFGELLSDSQTMLRLEHESVIRLVAGAPITTGDTLVSIAGFRPEVLFANGGKLILSDATRVASRFVDDRRLGLRIDHGRVVLRGSDVSRLLVRLESGGTEFDLELNGSAAIAALESVPYQMANGEVSRAVRLLHTRGVALTSSSSANEVLNLNEGLITEYTYYPGGTAVTRVSSMPGWVTGAASDSILQEARAELSVQLSGSEDLAEVLQQVYESHRLINVRRLAAYGLMELGNANAFAGLLDDSEYRALWHQDVRLLQEYYHRDEASQRAVESALSSYSGDQTEQLLSFLCEYDDEQLLAGVGDDFVQQLESQVTAVRVIAFYRLKQMTGKTLLYQADESPQRQSLPIREWQELLAEGELTRYQTDMISSLFVN